MIHCTTLLSIPNLGHVSGNEAASSALPERSRLALPFWQAELLALHDIVFRRVCHGLNVNERIRIHRAASELYVLDQCVVQVGSAIVCDCLRLLAIARGSNQMPVPSNLR